MSDDTDDDLDADDPESGGDENDVETETPTAAILDGDDRPFDQLPLSAFDESTSKSDLVREVIDAEKDRDEDLNAIGDVLADLEELAHDGPVFDAETWAEMDPAAKRTLVEVRLSKLVDAVKDSLDDGLRAETESSNIGYW